MWPRAADCATGATSRFVGTERSQYVDSNAELCENHLFSR